jgi:hypothetical protein
MLSHVTLQTTSEPLVWSLLASCPRLEYLKLTMNYNTLETEYMNVPTSQGDDSIRQLKSLKTFDFTMDLEPVAAMSNEPFLSWVLKAMPNLRDISLAIEDHVPIQLLGGSPLLSLQPLLKQSLRKITLDDTVMPANHLVNFMAGLDALTEIDVSLVNTSLSSYRLVENMAAQHPALKTMWVNFCFACDMKKINYKMSFVENKIPLRPKETGPRITWHRTGLAQLKFIIS